MPIVDQFSNPVSSNRNTKLVHSSDRYSNGLQWQPDLMGDINDLFNESDWRSTVTQSRLVVSNFAVPRACTIQKATNVAGTGWALEYTGTNADWGRKAVKRLSEWLDKGAINGVKNFNLNIKTDSMLVSRDGDFFLLKIIDPRTNAPRYQRIPAHRVGTRHIENKKELDGTAYEGMACKSGVVYNGYGEVVAYKVLGDEEKDDRLIPSAEMIHISPFEWVDQARGMPDFSAVIQELRKSKLSEDWELMAQMIMSSYALVEYNEEGMPDPNDPDNYINAPSGGVAGDTGITSQSISGGAVKYFRSNSGAKLESINSARPSDMWEKFQDRVNRAASVASDWPYELSWKIEKLNNVSVRNVQERARQSVSNRQMLLKDGYYKLVYWGLAVLVKNGVIPAPRSAADWHAFDFLMPPQFSIDPRHDNKTEIEQFRAGVVNMTQIQRAKGRDLESHWRQRCDEIALRKRIKYETEERYGIEIDDREILMLTANDLPDDDASEEEEELEPVTDTEPNPENDDESDI